MAQLKFKGSLDHRVPKPNTYFIGQRPQYLGLSYTEAGEIEACEFTIDDSTAAGQWLLNAVRRDGCFVPVDEAACNAVGVTYQAPSTKKSVTTNV